MGLLILFAVGGVLGWLSSIVLAVNEHRKAALYVLSGVVGAIVVGAFAASTSLADSITPATILFGALGAAAFLALVHIFSSKRSR